MPLRPPLPLRPHPAPVRGIAALWPHFQVGLNRLVNDLAAIIAPGTLLGFRVSLSTSPFSSHSRSTHTLGRAF